MQVTPRVKISKAPRAIKVSRVRLGRKVYQAIRVQLVRKDQLGLLETPDFQVILGV